MLAWLEKETTLKHCLSENALTEHKINTHPCVVSREEVNLSYLYLDLCTASYTKLQCTNQ